MGAQAVLPMNQDEPRLRDLISDWVKTNFLLKSSRYGFQNDVVVVGYVLIIAQYPHADIEDNYVLFYKNGPYVNNPDILNRGELILYASDPEFFNKLNSLIIQVLRAKGIS